MSKPIFKYDIATGHYIMLNEDESMSKQGQEEANQDSQKSNEQEEKSEGDQVIDIKPVEGDPTIVQLTKTLNDKKVTFDREMSMLNQQLMNAKSEISNKMSKGEPGSESTVYDPVQTDPNILGLENKILTKQTEFNNFKLNIDKQILARKKQLAAVKEGKALHMPNKLLWALNESAISKCKIYIDPLIGEDRPIFNKYTMNRCFKNTNLVYGKDKKRYFVVILDEDDVNELYDALLNYGYDLSEIQTVLLSELMNRRNFV